ncbi:MAG: acyl-CoA dehydrogenase family protein [Myxococcales bacterium]|nr:acyl-CoA dehydrogenase family protein [Myxococcales bacterium]
MDFSTPPATTELLAKIRGFVEERLLPREAAILGLGFADADAELQALRAEVKALGLWGPQLPTSIGGLGLPLLDHGLVSELLGYSPLGHYVFGAQAPDAGNIEILEKYGTPAQRERWLDPLAAGEIRSCFSMTEPDNAGSNPTLLACAARRDGDEYVIDGRKWFTTAADGAAFAIVMAITDPEAEAHRRATMIIVPTDTPGFRLVRNISIFGHAGGGYDSHAEIAYEGCRVPATNRLGPEGAGFVIAQERLGPGRIHHCMRWLGICRRAFDMLCARANARELAPGERLADKQIIQAWVAECRARIDAARLLTLHAAWTIDNHGFQAARESVSLIKFHVAEVLGEVLDRAIQAHGALGITDDTVLSFFYTRERGARIYDGPDEVHKMVVARRILSGYRRRAAGGGK